MISLSAMASDFLATAVAAITLAFIALMFGDFLASVVRQLLLFLGSRPGN